MREVNGWGAAEEQTGRWWLPDLPRRARTGRLAFDPERGAGLLTLDGGFPEQASGSPTYPTVLGRLNTGEKVTLLGGLRTGTHADLIGRKVRSETIQFETAFEGAHIRDPASTYWNRVIFRVRGFDNWLAAVGLEEHAGWDEEDEGTWETVRFYEPNDLELELSVGTMRVRAGNAISSEAGKRHEVRRSGSLYFELGSARTFEKVLDDVIRPMEYLFSMVFDSPAHTTSIQIAGSVYQSIGGRRLPKFLNVRGYSLRPESSDNRIHWSQMMFNFGQAKVAMPGIVDKWFDLYARLSDCLHLLFGPLLGPSMYLESRFLLIAQAAEVYHRRQFPNSVDSPGEHRARLEAITSAIPPHHHAWIKEKLAHSNEPRVRDRIEELRSKAFSAVRLMRNDLAPATADTRNYLTHFSRKSRRVAEGTELHRLTEELRLMMYGCLLLDCGVDPETAWSWISRLPSARSLF